MTLPTSTLPLPRQSAGIPISHLTWNDMEEWIEWMAGFVTVAEAAVIHSTGTTSVPNGPGVLTGAWASDRTYPTFNAVDYDPVGMSNLSGGGHSSQVLTALDAGLYIAFGYGQWSGNATGFRALALDLGGDAGLSLVSNQGAPAPGGFPTFQFAAMFAPLTAGTQVALRVDQGSGGALTFQTAKLALARVALAA